MNKQHEKYYRPLEEMKMDQEEYNYRCFCMIFEEYAHIFIFEHKEFDPLKDLSRNEIQHNIHDAAFQYKIDRGDFAKVNNLEGFKCWYDMIVEYRKRLKPKDLYVQQRAI